MWHQTVAAFSFLLPAKLAVWLELLHVAALVFQTATFDSKFKKRRRRRLRVSVWTPESGVTPGWRSTAAAVKGSAGWPSGLMVRVLWAFRYLRRASESLKHSWTFPLLENLPPVHKRGDSINQSQSAAGAADTVKTIKFYLSSVLILIQRSSFNQSSFSRVNSPFVYCTRRSAARRRRRRLFCRSGPTNYFIMLLIDLSGIKTKMCLNNLTQFADKLGLRKY